MTSKALVITRRYFSKTAAREFHTQGLTSQTLSPTLFHRWLEIPHPHHSPIPHILPLQHIPLSSSLRGWGEGIEPLTFLFSTPLKILSRLPRRGIVSWNSRGKCLFVSPAPRVQNRPFSTTTTFFFLLDCGVKPYFISDWGCVCI